MMVRIYIDTSKPVGDDCPRFEARPWVTTSHGYADEWYDGGRLIDALLHSPLTNRHAVKLMTQALRSNGFIVTPDDFSLVWHIKYVYDRPKSLKVVYLAVITLDPASLPVRTSACCWPRIELSSNAGQTTPIEPFLAELRTLGY